ncbi:MAG: hypothetical protein ACLF0G_14330 [Candidatus Brocadiia bacterium]
MPSDLQCPSCGATFAAGDEKAGATVECPRCGQEVAATPGPPAPPPLPDQRAKEEAASAGSPPPRHPGTWVLLVLVVVAAGAVLVFRHLDRGLWPRSEDPQDARTAQVPEQERSGSIYGAAYPADQEPRDDTLLRILQPQEAVRVRDLVAGHVASLATKGRHEGAPGRTLVLAQKGLKLLYGGALADEFVVYTLEGEKKGHFHSMRLVNVLRDIEEE